jgi:hypothetical protein
MTRERINQVTEVKGTTVTYSNGDSITTLENGKRFIETELTHASGEIEHYKRIIINGKLSRYGVFACSIEERRKNPLRLG